MRNRFALAAALMAAALGVTAVVAQDSDDSSGKDKVVAEEYFIEKLEDTKLEALDEGLTLASGGLQAGTMELEPKSTATLAPGAATPSLAISTLTIPTGKWIGEGSQEFDTENPTVAPDLVPGTAEYDPKADGLHPEAKTLYLRANQAYRMDGARKYPFVRISSGKRTTKRQAELFIAFVASRYGGSAAPRTHVPGTSGHEYGVSLDIIRKGDEARLKKAMTEAGWSHLVADEGWHFDASGAPGWGKLQKAIAEVGQKYSKPFATSVDTHFKLLRNFNKGGGIYKAAKPKLAAEHGRLKQRERTIAQEGRRLGARKKKIQDAVAMVQREKQALLSLKSRIENARYGYCPVGRGFQQCTHVAEKRRFVNQVNAAVRNFNQRRAVYNRAVTTVKQAVKRWNYNHKRWNSDRAQFKQEAAYFNKSLKAFNGLAAKLKGWAGEINKLRAALPGQLGAIVKAVARVQAGQSAGSDDGVDGFDGLGLGDAGAKKDGKK